MSRNLPPLNALRAFEAAARHSSFSRASDELKVAHTSVARHVRNLEEWLGIKLFAKSGRGVFLTEKGERYFQEVAALFDRMESATTSISAKGAPKVTLSIEPLFMHQWFAKRFYSSTWTDKMSGFEIDIQSSTKVSDLNRGEADLAIRFTVQPIEEIDSETIIPQVFYPFMAPSLLEASPWKSPIEVLLEQNLIYDLRPERWEFWFKAAGYDKVPRLNLLKQGDQRVAMLATLSGNAAILLSPELMQDEIAAGRVVQVSDIGLPNGHFALLSAEGALERPEVRAAKDVLQKLMSQFGASTKPAT